MKRGQQRERATEMFTANGTRQRKSPAVRDALESLRQLQFAGTHDVFDVSQQREQLRGTVGNGAKAEAFQRLIVRSRTVRSRQFTTASNNRSPRPQLAHAAHNQREILRISQR